MSALPAVVIQYLSSVVSAFPCHRLWFDKSFLHRQLSSHFLGGLQSEISRRGYHLLKRGWDAPSSLGSFYWAHWGSTPIQAGRTTAYFKVLFPDFQPFLQANWWKCFPLLTSIHINIKHLQTAAACVWMQQCEMVAMSVKLQSRGQKCDCVCSDVFKPLWFLSERFRWDKSFDLCCVRVWLLSVLAADQTSMLMWLSRQTSCSSPYSPLKHSGQSDRVSPCGHRCHCLWNGCDECSGGLA